MFNIRIKLEQFQLAESKNGKCSSDSFSISIQKSGGGDSVERTRLLCGQKSGQESKENVMSHGKLIFFVSVLLPVTQGSIVLFNFDIGSDEAIWRLKIAKEGCSENIPTSILGEMTC